jgi:hypothetical protein
MTRPFDARRWRWVTSSERSLSQEERELSHLKNYWVPNNLTPTGNRRSSGWWIEVELNNGQRIFYRAY